MNITKKLYCHFVEDFSNTAPDYIQELEGWYPAYKKLNARVLAMRYLLIDGYELDPKRDKPFLNDLIYEHHNPISAGGHFPVTQVSPEKFENLINSSDFLKSLSEMIKIPNLENFKAFGNSWRDNKGGNFRHRINRIFAACTYDVSSTTSVEKFTEAFATFNNYELIKPYHSSLTSIGRMREEQWYKENVYLMTELRKIFQNELMSGEVDLTKLSIFVWEVCANSKGIPNLINRFSA